MNKELIKSFNLPGYVKNKSFAEASKAINNKFKDRNDNISTKTKEELLERLAKAQEYVKMKENVSNIDNTSNDYNFGGYMQAGSGLLQMGDQLFGNTNIDTSGNVKYNKVNENKTAISGLASGAMAGSALGPIGAGAGALFGGTAGLLGGKRKNKEIQDALNNNTIAQSNQYDNTFEDGGYLNERPNSINTDSKNTFNKATNWLGKNYGDILSYAPIVSNITDKIDKPNTQRGIRLDNMYEKSYVDENSLLNNIISTNTDNSLQEASGGDLGALRNNLIASDLMKKKAISDSYLKLNDINRNENRIAQQFNLNKDRFNANQEERYIERKARDEGAYNTAKSIKRNALFEDLGKIGREESNKNLVEKMFGYKWNGEYWVDKKGNKIPQEDVNKIIGNLNN